MASYNSSEPLPAKAVANYFLDKAKISRRQLTPMKLQKLVYIAHGWHLALFDGPLIRERVQAWRWGPVIEDLYHEFKEFAKQPITQRAHNYSFDDFVIKRQIPEIHFVGGDSDRTKALLDRVWEVYSVFTATQLSRMTHMEETPWRETAKKLEAYIPQKLIRDYYRARAAKNDQ